MVEVSGEIGIPEVQNAVAQKAPEQTAVHPESVPALGWREQIKKLFKTDHTPVVPQSESPMNPASAEVQDLKKRETEEAIQVKREQRGTVARVASGLATTDMDDVFARLEADRDMQRLLEEKAARDNKVQKMDGKKE